MTTIRPFTCEDMLYFNNVLVILSLTITLIFKSLLSLFDYYFRNLDPLTETYGLSFYTQYLAHWPEFFQVAESPSGEIMGYSKRHMNFTIKHIDKYKI